MLVRLKGLGFFFFGLERSKYTLYLSFLVITTVKLAEDEAIQDSKWYYIL